MTAARIRWTVLGLLYALFLYWYGGWTTPLTRQEVAHYVGVALDRLSVGARGGTA